MDSHQLVTIRPELLSLSIEQLGYLAPYLWVFGAAVLGTMVSSFRKLDTKWPVWLVTVIGLVMGMASSYQLISADTQQLFNRMLVSDSYSHFFNFLFLAMSLATVLVSFRYLDREGIQYPEYNLLILFAATGMMLMTAATDLIVLFIALEIMSLSVYLLVGFRRSDRKANEAAMKYFVLGGVASAVFLYGSALLYGAAGSTRIPELLAYVQSGKASSSYLFAFGSWLLIAGFLFKVAAVPFHMWMPDVYEGAPTPVTGFMTTALKAAVFATFLRVIVSMGFGKGLLQGTEQTVHHLLWVAALITMLVGNVIALTQTNLKRMLAYSSIAHTGYILVGVIASFKDPGANAAIVMYLASYAIMNLGAFIVLTHLGGRGDTGMNLQDLNGLSQRHPLLALCLAVFLFSMAGIPPTAGFIGKYLVFYSAVQAGELPLVILGVLCSAISVYYYLRVMVFMYMREPESAASANRIPVGATVALATLFVLTLQVGVMPKAMVESAKRVIMHL